MNRQLWILFFAAQALTSCGNQVPCMVSAITVRKRRRRATHATAAGRARGCCTSMAVCGSKPVHECLLSLVGQGGGAGLLRNHHPRRGARTTGIRHAKRCQLTKLRHDDDKAPLSEARTKKPYKSQRKKRSRAQNGAHAASVRSDMRTAKGEVSTGGRGATRSTKAVMHVARLLRQHFTGLQTCQDRVRAN